MAEGGGLTLRLVDIGQVPGCSRRGMSLSAEQEADCQEAFTLFDRGGSGKLKVAELGGVLRALGHNLAGDELSVTCHTQRDALSHCRSRPYLQDF